MPKAKRNASQFGKVMAWSHPNKQANTYLDLYIPSRKEEGSYSSSLGVGATVGIRSLPVLRSSHRNPPPFYTS
jgi:hypothetical protein